MPRWIARPRKPATQRAKAGDCVASDARPSVKLALAPNANDRQARRVRVPIDRGIWLEEIRGMAAVYAPRLPINSPLQNFAMEPASILGLVAPPVADTMDMAAP